MVLFSLNNCFGDFNQGRCNKKPVVWFEDEKGGTYSRCECHCPKDRFSLKEVSKEEVIMRMALEP